MPESTKTIGIIGYGSIGKRHWTNLEGLGCKVLGYDPGDKHSDSLQSVLDSSDAFVIASPTDTHFEYLNKCAEQDKSIFVEKPVASTRDQLIDLRSLPTIMGDIFVGYNLRFHPCVKKAHEWLEDDAIGKILWAQFVCAQYSNRQDYRRDGVILNWSHEIDLALQLLGPAKIMGSSTRISNGQDDMTDILLSQADGCLTTIHLDYLTRPQRRGFMIVGTDGQIHCDLPSRNVRMFNLNSPALKDEQFSGSFDNDYIDEMKAFLDHIDGKQTIGATGTEALDVLDICLKVREQAGLSI